MFFVIEKLEGKSQSVEKHIQSSMLNLVHPTGKKT